MTTTNDNINSEQMLMALLHPSPETEQKRIESFSKFDQAYFLKMVEDNAESTFINQ